MTAPIKWGIIGTGNIAKKMAQAINNLPDAELVAVGSRAQATAEAFGEQFSIPRRYAGYRELAGDPEVDIIYVATPHNFHKDNSILCLENGKAVLCEKPFAVNAAEAEQMINTARERKVFLMEAMWSRFLPTLTRCREALKQGVIGEVRMVYADFGFRAGWDPKSRLLNPNLAGGALLDVGTYTVSFASMVMGSPKKLATLAYLGTTGVDEQSGVILGYDHGRLAMLSSAIRTSTPMEASILGTDGMIRLHNPWWCGTRISISAGNNTEDIELPFIGNGFEHEATEAMRCLRERRLESDILPLNESLSITRTLDAIRAQWGLKYPTE